MSGPNLLGRRGVVQDSSREAKAVVSGLLGGVSARELKQIPLTSIRAEEQVRREFSEEAHRALVENIREQGGVIEPIIVNLIAGDSKYLLVAGERRLLACEALVKEFELAGDVELAESFSFIPAIVYVDLSPTQVREMQLSENLVRLDLTDLEETLALTELLAVRLGLDSREVPSVLERLEKEGRGERKVREDSQEQLRVVEETFAAFSSVTWRTFVKKRQHLLRLPEDLLVAVRSRRVTSAQAELIGRLDGKGMRENLVEQVERGMSLDELAVAVQAVNKKPVSMQPPEVQVALRVRKHLTPKRLVGLPPESRRRVQELLEEVGRLLERGESPPTPAVGSPVRDRD